MEVDQETAVAQFMALARSCHERRLTAAEIVSEMVRFYRDVRIAGVAFEAAVDALQFQWGVSRLLLFCEPTDLRALTDDDLMFDDVESNFLELTRVVFAPGDDKEAEFDDEAIHMSVFLVYGPADSTEDGGDIWISSFHEVDDGVNKFMSKPFVSRLLHSEPVRYVSLVGFIG